jgi:hypothetical protein
MAELRRVTVPVPRVFGAIAESEKRSVSNLVFKVLSDYVEKREQRRVVKPPRPAKP